MLPDTRHAVEIGDRVYWVGHEQEGDPFQCHAYLIEQGDESVLIDPGSMRTFAHTLRKVEEIVPFKKLRYFICQHQDPDIAASLPTIGTMVTRPDARLVTHWRADMLLQHYALPFPTLRIDEHEWELVLQDRTLRFVFTPYAHFPGAFCTFDPASGVLFSSDIFGALDEHFSLYAEDDSHFEHMRVFHEHYMPSRDILDFALEAIGRMPFQVIAPQHGSILREPLARRMLERLRHLDCGLYLLAGRNTDIMRISRLNSTLREITQALSLYRDFRDIASRLIEVIRRSLPARAMRFYAPDADGSVLVLRPETRYRGEVLAETPPEASALGIDRVQWRAAHGGPTGESDKVFELSIGPAGEHLLTLPLFAPERGNVMGLCCIELESLPEDVEGLAWIAEQLALPLQVALERELILREMDQERHRVYERSIRDPLTGLFTRVYMQDALTRHFGLQDRNAGGVVTIALVDIDHFKRVNDTWGHNQGDDVLREVGRALLSLVREADLAIRFGGEELAIFSVGQDEDGLASLAERIRLSIAALRFGAPMEGQCVTVSIGTARRRSGESLEDLVERADRALYAAKEGGRNRVIAG